MKRKLILFNTLIVTLALVLSSCLGIMVTKSNHYTEVKENVKEITSAYAGNYISAGQTAKTAAAGYRVTVVGSDGMVLSDSETTDLASMGNHMNRAEILAALDGKPATFVRFSDTLKKDMVYYAEKVDLPDGDYVFIRVAKAVDSVNGFVLQLIPLTVVILLGAVLVSFILSLIAANSLVKPLKDVGDSLKAVANGTYRSTIPASGDADVDEVLSELNEIGDKLQTSLTEAKEGRDRLHYVIENVSDGIVVLQQSGKISLINHSAEEAFGIASPVGREYTLLSDDAAYIGGVSAVLSGKKQAKFDLILRERCYAVTAKAPEEGVVILVLSDVTAERQSEKIRSEFFANASHELKTPLTAVKGFNDIIRMTTTDEKIRSYSEKIDKETDRVVKLIGDMLDLSRLETVTADAKEPVDVSKVAGEIKESLAPLAEKKEVSVSLSGNCTVFAEKEHVTELVKNLLENAVRYNEAGGKAEVILSETAEQSIVTVKDNGIGIAKEDQGRLFERFYRVNKSRSRETGGTGLGLAIVKHVAERYGAELRLTSTPGVGTTVTVAFPKVSAEK